MKLTFEDYLIMVGIRSSDYTYNDEQILYNTEYFRKCYNEDLSAYKALLFLNSYISSKTEQIEQFICPCCGSDKTYLTEAIHCSRCAVTTEI